jgi:flagellar basal-body rod protein FlgF
MNIYSSASAMRHLEVWQSTVAQNIAAGQQPGYKSLQVSLEKPGMSGNGKDLPLVSNVSRDFSGSSARRTERMLDVAFSGEGFIAANDGNERPILMRNGELQVSADGRLLTAGGHEVDGLDGPIQVVANAADPHIDTFGEVWQGQTSIGRIRAVTVDQPEGLTFDGVGWRIPTGPDGEPLVQITVLDNPELRPGYLEEGNLSPMRSMITLMQITRAFEANQKALQTVDEMVDRTIRSVQ